MRSWLLFLAAGAAACGRDPAAIPDAGPNPIDGGTDATAADATAADAGDPDAPIDAGTPDADPTPGTFFGNNAVDQAAGGVFPTSGSAAVAAQAAFVARLTRRASEGFEAAPLGALPGAGDPASLQVLTDWGGGRTRLEQSRTGLEPAMYATVSEETGYGRFNTTPGPGGVVDVGRWLQSAAAFTLNLGEPADAVGMFITDAGDFGSTLRIELAMGATVVDTLEVPPVDAIDGNLAFYGRVDPSRRFDRVVVTIVDGPGAEPGSDVIGFDDLIVGTID